VATDTLNEEEDIYDEYMIDEHCKEAEETERLIMNGAVLKENKRRWFLSHPDWGDYHGFWESKKEATDEKWRLEGEHITVYANDPIQVEEF